MGELPEGIQGAVYWELGAHLFLSPLCLGH